MQQLRVLLALAGAALVAGCRSLLGARPGSFSEAARWERVWVRDPGVHDCAGQPIGMDLSDARRGWVGYLNEPLMLTSDVGSTWTGQHIPAAGNIICFDF